MELGTMLSFDLLDAPMIEARWPPSNRRPVPGWPDGPRIPSTFIGGAESSVLWIWR
jgi:hypothetical protein